MVFPSLWSGLSVCLRSLAAALFSARVEVPVYAEGQESAALCARVLRRACVCERYFLFRRETQKERRMLGLTDYAMLCRTSFRFIFCLWRPRHSLQGTASCETCFFPVLLLPPNRRSTVPTSPCRCWTPTTPPSGPWCPWSRSERAGSLWCLEWCLLRR